MVQIKLIGSIYKSQTEAYKCPITSNLKQNKSQLTIKGIIGTDILFWSNLNSEYSCIEIDASDHSTEQSPLEYLII